MAFIKLFQIKNMTKNNPTTNINEEDYEFFNLKKYLNLIFRNKQIISLSSIIFFLAACMYSLTMKRIWQGNFQIVIENSDTEENLSSIISKPSKGLNTEITILKSPSVLMPVFEYVKSIENPNQKNKDLNSYDFEKWKKDNLLISLIDETKVLSIKYQDSNKAIILPVLQKISNTYQEFSGKNNSADLKLEEDYLENQVKIYSEKASNSIKKVQLYAIDQDLSIAFVASDNINRSLDNPITDVELTRAKAANEIRLIDEQIKEIKKTKDLQKLQYLGSTISILSEKGLTMELENIENQLVETRAKYKDNSYNVLKLVERRKLMIDLLKKRSIGILNALKVSTKAEMEAAKRPKKVLLNYKELIREAQRDELNLVRLENQLSEIKLKKAKKEQPWRLITKPTLRNNPIAPSRKRIGLIGLFGGFLFGFAYSLFREKKSNIFYEIEELESLFKLKVLNKRNSFRNDSNFITSFFEDLKSEYKTKNISLLLIGNEFEFNKKLLLEFSKSKIENEYLFIVKSLADVIENNFNFIVLNLDNFYYEDAQNLKIKLEYLNINFDGIILI